MWDDKPKPTDTPTDAPPLLPTGVFLVGVAVGGLLLVCVVCGVFFCRQRRGKVDPETQALNADTPPAYTP